MNNHAVVLEGGPARRLTAGRGGRRRWALALGAGCAAVALLASPVLASTAATSERFYSQQWALHVMKVAPAWNVSTGSGVVVAVIDTGVAFGIDDLPSSKSAGSYDCTGTGGSPTPCPTASGDPVGHGTWVASVVAGETSNSSGMAGVAPNAKILSVRAVNSQGAGTTSDIAHAVEFAADQGAQVINLSLGGDSTAPMFKFDCPTPPCLSQQAPDPKSQLQGGLQPAFDYAASKGALVVVAAGNGDSSNPVGPSLYLGMNNVLIVGASGPHDEAASYSDTGTAANFVWAPGGDGSCASNGTANCIILADKGGGYVVSEGTSFAAPQVAGIAALLMADGYSAPSAAQRIESTADQVAAGPRADAQAALGASGSASPSSPPVQPANNTSPQTVAPPSPTHPATSPSTRAASPKPSSKATTSAPPAAGATSPSAPASSPSSDPSPTAAASPPSSTSPATSSEAADARRTAAASRPAPLGRNETLVVALALFIAASAGAGVTWLTRRTKV